MARQSLGRGLSALLDEDTPSDTPRSAGAMDIDIDRIEPNPEQPRTRFAEDSLDELARSIQVNGIVQPIIVRERNGRYQIIAGERRWRAAQRAGLRQVPVLQKEVPDDKLLEIALVENIQRQELNPIEEAKAFHSLIGNLGLTQEIVAERVGKDRAVIANTLRLLRLPNHIQEDISAGRMSAGHGRALLGTTDSRIQNIVSKTILEMGISVRETERAIKRLIRSGLHAIEKKEVAARVDPNMKAAETQLVRHLGTQVKILPKAKGSGGKIEIEYYGDEDLTRIYDLLMKK
ncbi:MAG: ParB/RepB/Spo0J family partition protein [Pyrinomonadaceae bacterium]